MPIAGRWTICFLDQDGIPTLVEVKRASDTRIRREVVGQMFDYAANALLHWPLETFAVRLKPPAIPTNKIPMLSLPLSWIYPRSRGGRD